VRLRGHPRLARRAPVRLTCVPAACFDRLDASVERELGAGDADAVVPGMREHLQACAACAEEHAGLGALAAADR
jgi:hypothetical protein